jgi:hypothetical protein
MTIGCYNFFHNRQSEIFYVPIGRNEIVKIFPEVKQRISQLRYRISVLDYLTSYGIGPKIQPLGVPDFSSQTCDLFFETYIAAPLAFEMRVDPLRAYRKKSVDIDQFIGLREWLDGFGFHRVHPDRLVKKEVSFLTGGWFEEWVFYQLQRYFQFSDNHIATSVKIARQGIQNEFDVLFTLENAIYVIECKTSLFGADASRENALFNETCYKLAALRKDFGLFAKTFIFTLSELSGEPYASRSKYLDIRLADQSCLVKESDRHAFFSKMR